MKYTERLNDFYEELRLFILNKVGEIGVKSEFNNNVVIKLAEGYQPSLGEGKNAVEVGCYELYDNNGYSYAFGVLSYDDLVSLADYLEEL